MPEGSETRAPRTPTRDDAKRGGAFDEAFDALLGEHQRAARVQVRGVVEKRVTARRERTSDRRGQMVLLGVVGIVVLFVAGNITVQSQLYPAHFAFWDRARQQPAAPGAAARAFSMSQVVTAHKYPPVASLMSALAAWRSLSSGGAQFLLQSVQWFELDNPRTRGQLSMRQWAGVRDEVDLGDLFLNPRTGFMAGACGGGAVDRAERERAFAASWEGSRARNPWYAFFPPPSHPHFGRIGALAQLLDANTCDSAAALDLYRLFDGGLCEVAFHAIAANRTADQTFEHFFGTRIALEPDCAGAVAEGALDGALTGSTMALPLIGLATGPVAVGGAIALAVGGGAFGAFTGRARAESRCRSGGGRSGVVHEGTW